MSVGSLPFFDATLSNTTVSEYGGPGSLVGCDLYNPNATPVYVQFFDVAPANLGSIVLGSTIPYFWVPVAANSAIHGPFAQPAPGFVNGICMAATLTPEGSGAPASNVSVVGFTN